MGKKWVYVHHIHGGTLIVCVVVSGEDGRAGGIGYRGRRGGRSARNGIEHSVDGVSGRKKDRSDARDCVVYIALSMVELRGIVRAEGRSK